MGDHRVIDLSHLNIADVRTIDLSHLGIADAQPTVLDLSALNLPETQAQASNDKPDLRDKTARNTSPVGAMPKEGSDPNRVSGLTMLGPLLAPPHVREHSRPKTTSEILHNLRRLYLEGSSTNSQSSHSADGFHIDDTSQFLQNPRNQFLMDAENGGAMREPQTGDLLGFDPTGRTPADHPMDTDSNANSPGDGADG